LLHIQPHNKFVNEKNTSKVLSFLYLKMNWPIIVT
jgi:hypothetical protein